MKNSEHHLPQIDMDHSLYETIFAYSLEPQAGSLAQKVLEKFPQHQEGGLLTVDGYVPLLAGDKVTWLGAGIMRMYPQILGYITTNDWALARPEDITPAMQEVAAHILELVKGQQT